MNPIYTMREPYQLSKPTFIESVTKKKCLHSNKQTWFAQSYFFVYIADLMDTMKMEQQLIEQLWEIQFRTE